MPLLMAHEKGGGMEQHALTVLVEIKPGEVEPLRRFLTEIGDDIEENAHLRFRESRLTHFARLVILDPVPGFPPRLLFTSNHDGSLGEYARELVDTFGARMEPILSRCAGYPAGAVRSADRFARFLEAHSVRSQVFYAAYRGNSVQTVQDSMRLREMVDGLLDRPDARHWLGSARDLLPPPPGSAREARPSPLGRALKALYGEVIQRLVGIKPGVPNNPNIRARTHPELARVEDRVVQNQMTILSPIRPDFRAQFMIRLVLWQLGRQAKQAWGSLSGLTTIHFARWAILDGGKYLLFESNYDGTWENYIDDFVDYASAGMNAIWGNSAEFPTGGCRDIEWFKKVIRQYQYPAQVFYSAYPSSTVRNVITDLQFAQASAAFLRREEVARFVTGAYGSSAPIAASAPSAQAAGREPARRGWRDARPATGQPRTRLVRHER
jgi:hypothetical protein